MVSGIPFSAEEQAFILAHAYTMTWAGIARELVARFPGDNGGSRSGRWIRDWVRAQEHGGIVTVRTRVPRELLASAGVRPQDLDALVVETLRQRAKA